MSTATIVGKLNREWQGMRDDEAVNARVAAWAETDARLSGARSLGEIEECARRPIDHRTDGLFAALLDRAANGGADGQLAARIVAQLMLGRAVLTMHALRNVVVDAEERSQLVVAALWESIAEVPPQRRSRITPWLAWDVHARAKRAAAVGAAPMEIATGDDHELMGEPPAVNASEELARVLAWAVGQGVLSEGDAELLGLRYGSEGTEKTTWSSVGDTALIADELGTTPAAVRQRCSRAARRLSQAAARYIATNVF
jgi:hypothetical protein